MRRVASLFSFAQKIFQYDSEKKTVFILEGVTPYLQPESVEETLRFVSSFSGVNSVIAWDILHSCWLRRLEVYRGGDSSKRSVFSDDDCEHLGMGVTLYILDYFASWGMDFARKKEVIISVLIKITC